MVVASADTLSAAGRLLARPLPKLGSTPGSYPGQARLEAIGEQLGPGQRVIAYSANYGLPLMYYSKLMVTYWSNPQFPDQAAVLGEPIATDAEQLRALIASANPHYFIVVPFSAPPIALTGLLSARYATVLSEPDLQVYDLTQPRPPAN